MAVPFFVFLQRNYATISEDNGKPENGGLSDGAMCRKKHKTKQKGE